MRPLAILLLGFSLFGAIYGQEQVDDDDSKANDDTEVAQEDESSGEELDKRGDQTMTNIGYIFKGYNIIEGNPLSPGGTDPGFKSKIFQAFYTQNKKTDDLRYKIPDNIEIVGKDSCSASFTSDTVTSQSDYQRSLLARASASASGNIKIVQASFTASAEYSRMSKTLKTNEKTVIRTEATCNVYEARIQTGTPPEFTDNFLETVKRLTQNGEYGRFLDTFGTHYVESVDMGARYTKLEVISKEKKEKLRKNGVDVNLAAKICAKGIGSASTDKQLKITTEQKNAYERAIESTEVVSLGSKPPADGQDSTWMQSSFVNPLPTFYKLKSIVDIFRPEFFKNNDVDYNRIKSELSNYLKRYCKSLKRTRLPDVECEGPPKGCRGGSQCSTNAVCNDNSNSADPEQQYSCRCKPGYEGDGRICERELRWTLEEVIEQRENQGGHGIWGPMENCKDGVFASGIQVKAEKHQRVSDDTGLNAVCMKCGDKDKCSKIGPWGDWSDVKLCPEGSFLAGWRQNVEANMGWGGLRDDTAMDNVEYVCRDAETWEETQRLNGGAKEWGSWSRIRQCSRGQFICGISTRVEDPDGDDTALNDIKHQCCSPLLKKKAKSKRRRHHKKD